MNGSGRRRRREESRAETRIGEVLSVEVVDSPPVLVPVPVPVLSSTRAHPDRGPPRHFALNSLLLGSTTFNLSRGPVLPTLPCTEP